MVAIKVHVSISDFMVAVLRLTVSIANFRLDNMCFSYEF